MYDFGATGRQSCPIFFAFYLVFRTKCRKCPQVTLQNISGYSELMKKIIPRVARLWVPGVSPAASINFKGVNFFHWEEISVTLLAAPLRGRGRLCG